MSSLPQDITGIAKLYWCQLVETQKGAVFIAEGEVLQPERYAGLHTSCFIPLYDTGRNFRDNYSLLLTELRKLGVDTDSLIHGDVQQLEAAIASLRDRQPWFHLPYLAWYNGSRHRKRYVGRYVTEGGPVHCGATFTTNPY